MNDFVILTVLFIGFILLSNLSMHFRFKFWLKREISKNFYIVNTILCIIAYIVMFILLLKESNSKLL